MTEETSKRNFSLHMSWKKNMLISQFRGTYYYWYTPMTFSFLNLLTIMEIHQKRSLKERLLIKTFFILVFQYGETRNIFILNKKVCCIFVLRLYLFDYMHVEENTFVFIWEAKQELKPINIYCTEEAPGMAVKCLQKKMSFN